MTDKELLDAAAQFALPLLTMAMAVSLAAWFAWRLVRAWLDCAFEMRGKMLAAMENQARSLEELRERTAAMREAVRMPVAGTKSVHLPTTKADVYYPRYF